MCKKITQAHTQESHISRKLHKQDGNQTSEETSACGRSSYSFKRVRKTITSINTDTESPEFTGVLQTMCTFTFPSFRPPCQELGSATPSSASATPPKVLHMAPTVRTASSVLIRSSPRSGSEARPRSLFLCGSILKEHLKSDLTRK